ncbi:MFS transporter [Hyphococcus flavus]|uniref:MFS transporter n=1 Tax=Hyphococcus flavus TaxID=1866326 RepID=A0AAE9ZCI2_9PROT|nr:MFS transporter [Hyphococcus flavus]WDI30935.1 MFS transporter [Hyphococcus flavus]
MSDTTAQPGSTASTSRAYRLYVLIILTAVYTFNFLDRQIMGIVAPAVQEDLGLNDSQLGILSGFAFAVLYTTLGIPFARLSDRYNRVTIISLALASWSGFTALCGSAQNFTQLALARVGVGIGEAGGSPPSHSLISDFYPKEKRAGALAVYALGIPIGVTLAYLGGGWVLQNFDWRTTFLVLGIPGVLFAVLLKLTVREPQRGATEAATAQDVFKGLKITEPVGLVEKSLRVMTVVFPIKMRGSVFSELASLWRAAKHLLAIKSYRAIVIGLTAGSFASYAIASWIVVFFKRSHPDFGTGEVYFWLGIINGTAYVLGVFVGGNLVDKLAVKNKAAYGWVPVGALLLNAPFFLGAMWVSDPVLSLILWWPSHLLTGFYLGPCFALAQTLAPVSIRALSTAIFFFILNMIALGFGPTFVGIFSDILNSSGMTSELSLRIALSSTVIAGFISIFGFWYLSKKLPADWEKATGEKIDGGQT